MKTVVATTTMVKNIFFGDEIYYDNRHCPNGRTNISFWTDGIEEVISREYFANPHGFFRGGEETRIKITNFNFVVEMEKKKGSSEWTPRHAYLSPGGDKKALETFLKNQDSKL